jgi:heterodisulfide reductase subunit D
MIVYFAGCMATFREKEIAKTTIELLKKLNVEFSMLGSEEWCCGSVMLRSGNLDVAKQMIEHNVKAIKDLGTDTVVTSCAGCYRTIKQDYPKYLGELGFKVLHTPEFVLEFIESGKLKFKPYTDGNYGSDSSKTTRITYHDPCHLGRHMNIFDPPRKVLQAIEGLELVEMARSRENARCCGSGGGVASAYRDLSEEMADVRISDAIAVSADILTSACPFCTYALKSAAKRANLLDKLKVIDFSELLMKVIE